MNIENLFLKQLIFRHNVYQLAAFIEFVMDWTLPFLQHG